MYDHQTLIPTNMPGYPWLWPYFGPSRRTSILDSTGTAPPPHRQYGQFTDTVWGIYQRHGITRSSSTGEVLTGANLHRFRHTNGTGLLNERWSQYEVQKFLGHSSPTMMQSYAEIHEDTLRAKYEEFVQKSIDVSGRHQTVHVATAAEVERLRDRMIRTTLPNGYCTLPESQTLRLSSHSLPDVQAVLPNHPDVPPDPCSAAGRVDA